MGSSFVSWETIFISKLHLTQICVSFLFNSFISFPLRYLSATKYLPWFIEYFNNRQPTSSWQKNKKDDGVQRIEVMFSYLNGHISLSNYCKSYAEKIRDCWQYLWIGNISKVIAITMCFSHSLTNPLRKESKGICWMWCI